MSSQWPPRQALVHSATVPGIADLQAAMSYEVTGLQSNTVYAVMAVTSNIAGAGSQSSTVQITTIEAPPDAPTGLTVIGTTSSQHDTDVECSEWASDLVHIGVC